MLSRSKLFSRMVHVQNVLQKCGSEVLHCLLHMPQFWPSFGPSQYFPQYAWQTRMCSKHCNTLALLISLEMRKGGLQNTILPSARNIFPASSYLVLLLLLQRMTIFCKTERGLTSEMQGSKGCT